VTPCARRAFIRLHDQAEIVDQLNVVYKNGPILALPLSPARPLQPSLKLERNQESLFYDTFPHFSFA
jgi:hypothetical protein